MIFASAIGYLFLFLTIVLPIVGALGSLAWLSCFAYRLQRRDRRDPWLSQARWWATALALLMVNLWTAYLWHSFNRITESSRLEWRNRESRKAFVMPRDFQYGELLIVSGSQIERYDPFDDGSPLRPLELAGLHAVRFPHPQPMAGVSAIAFEVYPGRIELAADHDFNGYICRRGKIAKFDVPLIDYDSAAEFGKRVPDGPAARFRPSEWRFRQCENGSIKIKQPSRTPPAFSDAP